MIGIEARAAAAVIHAVLRIAVAFRTPGRRRERVPCVVLRHRSLHFRINIREIEFRERDELRARADGRPHQEVRALFADVQIFLTILMAVQRRRGM